LAIPTISNCSFGPFAAAPIESPTAKSCFLAVLESITTSCRPVAQRPVTRCIGLKRGCEGSSPKPNVGLPFAWIAFPSRSISFVFVVSLFRSRIAPAAAETSGSFRIFTSSDFETVALPLFE
jgi:hypothetical protein